VAAADGDSISIEPFDKLLQVGDLPSSSTHTVKGTCDAKGSGTVGFFLHEGNGLDPAVASVQASVNCVEAVNCGDGMIQSPEDCDGSDLGTHTCMTEGFDGRGASLHRRVSARYDKLLFMWRRKARSNVYGGV